MQCRNCGSAITGQTTTCPVCGAPQATPQPTVPPQAYGAQPQAAPVAQPPYPAMAVQPAAKPGKGAPFLLGLVCGVLVLALVAGVLIFTGVFAFGGSQGAHGGTAGQVEGTDLPLPKRR